MLTWNIIMKTDFKHYKSRRKNFYWSNSLVLYVAVTSFWNIHYICTFLVSASTLFVCVFASVDSKTNGTHCNSKLLHPFWSVSFWNRYSLKHCLVRRWWITLVLSGEEKVVSLTGCCWPPGYSVVEHTPGSTETIIPY